MRYQHYYRYRNVLRYYDGCGDYDCDCDDHGGDDDDHGDGVRDDGDGGDYENGVKSL